MALSATELPITLFASPVRDGRAVVSEWRWKTPGEYDALCAGALSAGMCTLRFVPLELTDGSDALVVWVSEDALAVGTEKRVRLAPTQTGAQRLLDLAGGLFGKGATLMTFPTPRIVDAVYGASKVRLGSHSQKPYPGLLSLTSWLKDEDQSEADRAGRTGLIGNTGKELAVFPRLFDAGKPTYVAPAAAPGKSHFCEPKGPKTGFYGWYISQDVAGPPKPEVGPFVPNDPSLLPARMLIIQAESTCHREPFHDYPQRLRPVLRSARLNGKAVDLADVYGGSLERRRLVYKNAPSAPVIPVRYPGA
jgi:hypothetical protein